MKFPDHVYLEPDDCWDDEPEEPAWDEDQKHNNKTEEDLSK